MDFLSAVFTTIPDALILYIQAAVLALISGKRIIKSRLTLAIIFSIILKFIITLFIGFLPTGIAFIIALIYEFMSCILIWYVRRECTFSDIWITIIIQEFCSVICSIIYASLPKQIRELPCALSFTRITFALIIIIAAIFQRNKVDAQSFAIESVSRIIPNRVFALIFISLFIEGGIIKAIDYNKSYSPEKIQYIKILLFVQTAINAIVIIMLIISVVYQKYYGKLNQILKQQVDSQLRHYEKREKLNAEIRGFRHDFNNHIRCLESILAAKNYTEAKKYLQDLSGKMPSGEFLFRTGNYISDAILTEIQEANKNVRVKFKGIIPQNIDNADLCILLSNAMNNAVEACETLPGYNEISIYANCRQGIFTLIIKNPTVQTGYIEDILPKTSKPDKDLHGFGLPNIQRIVNKYDGTMHTLLKDGTFTLSLTLSVEQPAFIS